MKYFIDLIIGDRIGLRFTRDWYLGRTVYTLRMTPEEFEAMQLTIDRIFAREH